MSFASLILLVHAVVPHHHHENTACFIMPAEGSCDTPCSNPHDADHNKQHDTDSTNDCCSLNDFLAIIPDNYKQDALDVAFSCALNYANVSLSMIAVPDACQEQYISYKDFHQRPYLVNAYEVYATHGLGLRAPPSC